MKRMIANRYFLVKEYKEIVRNKIKGMKYTCPCCLELNKVTDPHQACPECEKWLNEIQIEERIK